MSKTNYREEKEINIYDEIQEYLEDRYENVTCFRNIASNKDLDGKDILNYSVIAHEKQGNVVSAIAELTRYGRETQYKKSYRLFRCESGKNGVNMESISCSQIPFYNFMPLLKRSLVNIAYAKSAVRNFKAGLKMENMMVAPTIEEQDKILKQDYEEKYTIVEDAEAEQVM